MEKTRERMPWEAVLKKRDDVTVMRVTVQDRIVSHDHAFIEIVYIDKGRGMHGIGTQPEAVMETRSGDLFVMNAGVPHWFVAERDKPMTVYNCLFNPETLDDSTSGGENFLSLAYRYLFHAPNGGVAVPFIRVQDSAAACAILREMFDECSRSLPGSELMNRANLTRLLLTIFRAYDREASPMSGDKPSLFGRVIVKNTMEYLQIHYGDEITCAQLAERVFVSPDHFSRMFKKAAGISPVRALQKIRMENAGRMLLETDTNVTDIARQVGYSDLKHFYQLFRDTYGTTPSRFRMKNGE